MNNQNKLQWKKLSNTSLYRILFDKENQNFLDNILSYKITEFEIDNLPSYYIISFIQVLQNYIYYYIKYHKNPYNNFIPNLNVNNNDLEEKISLKNEEIEKLNKKIIDYQEIINQKDKLLNDTNQQLFLLYNKYSNLEKEYNYQVNKLKSEIKKKEENFKEMDEKFFDTFDYLTKLFRISNEGKGQINENIKQIERNQNKLYTVMTYNNELNKIKGYNFNKQSSTNVNNNLRKVKTERNGNDKINNKK